MGFNLSSILIIENAIVLKYGIHTWKKRICRNTINLHKKEQEGKIRKVLRTHKMQGQKQKEQEQKVKEPKVQEQNQKEQNQKDQN